MGLTACSASTGSRGVDDFWLPVGQPITRAELAAYRESHLFYPGSKVIRSIGSNQISRPSEPEPDPAYTGAILTARVTADQLYAFYEHALSPQGFHTVNDYRLSSQVSGRAWEVDQRVQVQVGIFDPAMLEEDQKIATAPGPGDLVYEMVLVGYSKHPSGDSPQTTSTGNPTGSH